MKNSVRLQNVSKHYKESEKTITILDRSNWEINGSNLIAIIGKSGSGKSTLINLISGIDTPNNGSIYIGDTCISELPDEERAIFRRRNVGIVFQFFNLIPTLNVLDNAVLPLRLDGLSNSRCYDLGKNLLNRVGLEDKMFAMPEKLSGGEQQRVAIARSLSNNPEIILADEPTGSLDIETSKEILNLFLETVKSEKKTAIIVTHSDEIINDADEVHILENSKITRIK